MRQVDFTANIRTSSKRMCMLAEGPRVLCTGFHMTISLSLSLPVSVSLSFSLSLSIVILYRHKMHKIFPLFMHQSRQKRASADICSVGQTVATSVAQIVALSAHKKVVPTSLGSPCVSLHMQASLKVLLHVMRMQCKQ